MLVDVKIMAKPVSTYHITHSFVNWLLLSNQQNNIDIIVNEEKIREPYDEFILSLPRDLKENLVFCVKFE